MQMLRAVAIAALASTSAMAGWQRYSSNEYETDSPRAHPLAYFMVHPCLRPDPNEKRIVDCVPQDEPAVSAFKVRAELRIVGKIGKYTIYDMDYHYDRQHHDENILGAKSVLVESSPDQFHEIYVTENGGLHYACEFIADSMIVTAGPELLLKTEFYCGGNLVNNTEEYFAFNESGVTRLDFEPLHKAAQAAIPPGKGGIWSLFGGFDMPALTWTTGVNVEGQKTTCCQGSVTVHFRIHPAAGVVPVNAIYEPFPDQ